MQRNINHEHNVEFPQLEKAKQNIDENQKFYLGVGVGLALAFIFRPRRIEVVVVEK